MPHLSNRTARNDVRAKIILHNLFALLDDARSSFQCFTHVYFIPESSRSKFESAENYKAFTFVAISSGLLYVLINFSTDGKHPMFNRMVLLRVRTYYRLLRRRKARLRMIPNRTKTMELLRRTANVIRIHQIRTMIGVQRLVKIRKRKCQLNEINER